MSQSASGIGELMPAPGGPFWTGSTQGTATIHDHYVEFGVPPTEDEERNFDGAGATIPIFQGVPASQIALTIDPVACTYDFTYSPALDITGTTNDGSPPTQLQGGPGSAQGFALQIPPYAAGDPIPVLQGTGAFPAHTVLFQGTGSRYYPFDAILAFFFLGTVTENNLSSANVVWSFDPEELELVVDPKNYDAWMPEGVDLYDAGSSIVPENEVGTSIDVEATVRRKSDGLPPRNATVQSIEFQLVESSSEPGVALNAPPRSRLANPQPNDLQFDPARNAALTPSVSVDPADTSRARASQGVGNTATAQVSAYDWGAFGALEVVAKLDSGHELKGVWISDPSVERILLPKRDPSSDIADEWKRLYGVQAGTTDFDDSEDNPGGSGTDLGDGLSLYEEYRGFFVGEQHPLRRGLAFPNEGTQPGVKDLFVRNTFGPIGARGLKLLADQGGLNVHYELVESEIDLTNVVNFNAGLGAHRVDQHGIRLVRRSIGGLAGRAVGLPGSESARLLPRALVHVFVAPSGDVAYDASTIAHEVGHAISVMHHGESDLRMVTWTYDPLTGQVSEASRAGVEVVEIRSESGFGCATDGCPLTPAELDEVFPLVATTQSVYVAREGGEHSGHAGCFMRYDAGEAYAHAAAPGVRWWTGNEATGFQMDASATGTGVNHAGRSPRSRHRDSCSALGRGDCRHQIRVSDSLPDAPYPTANGGVCP
jgi:hypothetical protein